MIRTLEEQIDNARTDYMNGTVVYDLTIDVDFSHPKKTAEALAKVLFDRDISKWISSEDLTVSPTSTVELRIKDGHNKKIEEAIKETPNDLKYGELPAHYKSQINAVANQYLQARSKYYWTVYSATSAWVARKEMDNDAISYALGQLTSKIFKNIVIKTV